MQASEMDKKDFGLSHNFETWKEETAFIKALKPQLQIDAIFRDR